MASGGTTLTVVERTGADAPNWAPDLKGLEKGKFPLLGGFVHKHEIRFYVLTRHLEGHQRCYDLAFTHSLHNGSS